MSDQEQLSQENPEGIDQQAAAEDLEFLKAQARQLGIKFSNNIGAESLMSKISERQTELAQEAEAKARAEANANTVVQGASKGATEDSKRRAILQADALKLIRVRVHNRDPKKSELRGEIFTTGNDFVGTVKKMVPYGGVETHIPQILYNLLKEKEYLVIRSVTHPVTKRIDTTTSYEKEFNVEVLPPLSEDELKALAAKQMAASNA